MATSLPNYVNTYFTKRGSPVYTCSLDAEGPFDAVPRAILFQNAINVISYPCWVIMVKWNRSMSVHVKWGSILSELIRVCKGTSEGLYSPFLFNLFCQDLINELSQFTGGNNINNISFNVLCYADDLMFGQFDFFWIATFN